MSVVIGYVVVNLRGTADWPDPRFWGPFNDRRDADTQARYLRNRGYRAHVFAHVNGHRVSQRVLARYRRAQRLIAAATRVEPCGLRVVNTRRKGVAQAIRDTWDIEAGGSFVAAVLRQA